MDKDFANPYYYFEPEFYESIFDDLHQNTQMFYAIYNNRIIAVSIMLITKGMMNYHLSGSLSEYSGIAPTNLLLYEAALWGFDNGCKTFYLGGGVGSEEDGLYKFKKSFYRPDDLPRFYIGKHIFNQAEYNRLVEERTYIQDNKFFPQYRV